MDSNHLPPEKDWQQAQTDLNTAQNDMRAAETAVEAAHNRLRILGRLRADAPAPIGRLMELYPRAENARCFQGLEYRNVNRIWQAWRHSVAS